MAFLTARMVGIRILGGHSIRQRRIGRKGGEEWTLGSEKSHKMRPRSLKQLNSSALSGLRQQLKEHDIRPLSPHFRDGDFPNADNKKSKSGKDKILYGLFDSADGLY
jgi:hypothetical protein